MVPASLTTTLSASASVVLLAEVSPSIMFNSVAVASTAASFVKSACTSPETPSSKFISAALEVTAASFVKSDCTKPDTPSSKFNSVAVEVSAVLPKVNCPSGTISPAAPLSIRSSALASHCINAEAVSPNNFTSYPVSSTPTVRAASSCTAPSISTASRFVVPSMSTLPDISSVAAANSPPIVKLPVLGL